MLKIILQKVVKSLTGVVIQITALGFFLSTSLTSLTSKSICDEASGFFFGNNENNF